MRQCTVFQFRIDLLDDCVLPVDLVRQKGLLKVWLTSRLDKFQEG